VRGLTVEEFVQRDDLFIPRDMANLQTRILGAPLDPSTLPVSRADPYYGRLDRAAMTVTAAQEHLAALTSFGLTERFQDSLNLLCYTFGWHPMSVTQNLNPREAAAEKELVTDAARQRMRELNAMDIQVYQYAAVLFEERVQEMTEALLERYGTPSLVKHKYPLPQDTMHELLLRHHYRTTNANSPS
jgi:hypothetical protein